MRRLLTTFCVFCVVAVSLSLPLEKVGDDLNDLVIEKRHGPKDKDKDHPGKGPNKRNHPHHFYGNNRHHHHEPPKEIPEECKEKYKGKKPNKHDKCWEMDKTDEKIKQHLPKHLQDKVNMGQHLSDAELSEFELGYGPYREREDTKIIDVINVINKAKDVEGLVEGDMVHDEKNHEHDEMRPKNPKKLKKGKRELKDDGNSLLRKRDASFDRLYLWIDRVVPYEIDPALGESEITIREALTEISSKSCINFTKRDREENWIKFVREDGCWSYVGRQFWSDGYQKISLGANCIYKGIIIHEVMHALGFYHEQSRTDRDEYVEVFWENIQEGYSNNFRKENLDSSDTLGVSYDYESIMHYGKFSFTMDANKPTMLSIVNSSQVMGQRDHLSDSDVTGLNLLYDCKNDAGEWSQWSRFSRCSKEGCKKERFRFCMNSDNTKCKDPVSEILLHQGIDVETKTCTDAECHAQINGHWNKWGDWGECSVSCDIGKQTRKRECTDPAPENGGAVCPGSDTSEQSCQKRKCSAGPYDCTFDIDDEPTCSWSIDPSTEISWTRNQGVTPSSSTGPLHDHTSHSGYYLFIESSSPAKEGHKARLVSPVIGGSKKCLKFAYSMYGRSTGSLNIVIRDGSSKVEATVFTKSGNQLQPWHEDEVQIDQTSGFEIIIEAVRGSSFQGDIAIDDIIVTEVLCGATRKTENDGNYTRVGCYNSFGLVDGKDLFPYLKDLRSLIIWTEAEMYNSFLEIINLCYLFAKENNFEYFGIRFWGECWTGSTEESNYDRDGEGMDCHNGKWNETVPPFLIGRDYSVMIYKLSPDA